MLISESYKSQNVEKHNNSKTFGTSGKAYAEHIKALCDRLKTTDILDYGCGKSTLAQSLSFPIQQYDPAILKFSRDPHPADLVVCTDVMEHIEPECVENVLDHLKKLTRIALFATVCTAPALKSLPDGRNTHLTVQPYEWWLPKFWERFRIITFDAQDKNTFLITCINRDYTQPNMEIIK